MSCGPAESVGKLVDGINGVVDSTEAAIAALPKGIASIPGYAEVQMAIQIQQDLKRLKELADDPAALVEAAIPSLPLEFQQFIAEGNALVGETIEKAEFLNSLSEKYGNVDYSDPEELLGALNELGGDLNKVCEIVPNIQTRYGEFVEKGKQVSQTLSRPKNALTQIKNSALSRYEDVYDAAEQRAKDAKEAAKDPNSALGKFLFGENKKEVDVSKEEQKKYTFATF